MSTNLWGSWTPEQIRAQANQPDEWPKSRIMLEAFAAILEARKAGTVLKPPFECRNCGHKPTAMEVMDHGGSCSKCRDSVIAYTMDTAEYILALAGKLKETT